MPTNWTPAAMRKLDALCAEKVMGWKEIDGGWGRWYNADGTHNRLEGDWQPSSNWSDAGEVWEKMQAVRPDGENGHLCLHTSQEYDSNTEYRTRYRATAAWGHSVKTKESEVFADGGPLAITLAAVCAVTGKSQSEIEKECGL